MAAIPSTRTHEQIHHYFQLINPEIPEDRLRQCLEEHNYDTQRCEESLRKVSSQYLYQHPEVSHCSTLQTVDMAGRSVSPHPYRRYQSHSVSAEPYPRGTPDGRSDLPSLTNEGRATHGRHTRSTTCEEPFSSHHHQSTPREETHGPTTLNVNLYPGRPVSPRPLSATPRPIYDSGAWVQLDPPKRERNEVSIKPNQPDFRLSPVPGDKNPLQTQVLSPPGEPQNSRPGSSPRVHRHQRTPNSEESNSNGIFMPMNPPWINPGSIPSTVASQTKIEEYPISSPSDVGGHCAQYEPLDPSKEDVDDETGFIIVSNTHITGTSSPVSPPVLVIKKSEKIKSHKPNRNPKLLDSTHKPGHNDFFKEDTSHQRRRHDVKLKEKTYLEALLTHQKARYTLIHNRVEQTSRDVEAIRKEVSDMETELNNKRTQMPSSFPTTEAISKLRAEKQGLLIDVECLQRDITFHLARQRESHPQNDSFYQNMQFNNPYTPHPSQSQETATSKWSCKTCTLINHEFLTECEMCGNPRKGPLTTPPTT